MDFFEYESNFVGPETKTNANIIKGRAERRQRKREAGMRGGREEVMRSGRDERRKGGRDERRKG